MSKGIKIEAIDINSGELAGAIDAADLAVTMEDKIAQAVVADRTSSVSFAFDAAAQVSCGRRDMSMTTQAICGTMTTALTLHEEYGIDTVANKAVSAELMRASKETMFNRAWESGLTFFSENGQLGDRSAALTLLRHGASSFGLWDMSDAPLAGLAQHLLKVATPQDTVACLPGALQPSNNKTKKVKSEKSHASNNSSHTTMRGSLVLLISSDAGKKKVKRYTPVRDTMNQMGYQELKSIPAYKIGLLAPISCMAMGYGLEFTYYQYPDIPRILGWQVVVSRSTAMAMAFLTSFLFLSMSRTLLTWSSGCRCLSWVNKARDAHKELHIFAGQLTIFFGFIHTLGHLIGTAPGFITHTAQELNAVFGCANPDTTPGYIRGVDLGPLVYPKCPISHSMKETYTYMGVLFNTTPGISGIALWLVLLVVGWTGANAQRMKNFNRFWYVHNFAIFTWPILLFIHGANAWVGFGFPLVVFVSGLPILVYMTDRIRWRVRYYFLGGKNVSIVQSVVREGKGGTGDGALVKLRFKKPSYWHHRAGMYAFLNMPQYAKTEWHPFTICSGEEDETIDFLISCIGDWTQALAQRCLDSRSEESLLPKVFLDGPFSAPTQSAIYKEVLVCVGAGVGITPFLSLLSTLISEIESTDALPLREAHFFWMTRSPQEFLFGRRLISRIMSTPAVNRKIQLHLHVTEKGPSENPTAFLFRDAMRRQSEIDRKVFMAGYKQCKIDGAQRPSAACLIDAMSEYWGPQLPWCWANDSAQDLLWMPDLVEEMEASWEDSWQLDPGKQDDTQLCEIRRHSATPRRKTVNLTEFQNEVTRVSKNLGEFPSEVIGASAQAPHKPGRDSVEILVPVVFGRPAFEKEISAIGEAHKDADVSIYACGNNAIVKSLEDVCKACNKRGKHPMSSMNGGGQQYELYFERFG